MTFSDLSLLPYILFTASASAEQCFFMMQRSALEISRASGIDVRVGRRMLPLWYLLVWPAKLTKWAAAIHIGMESGWYLAIALLGATFLFQIFVPIPHRQFIPLFRRKISKEMGVAVNTGDGSDAKLYAGLYKMLFEVSQDSRFE
jgi:hypothetical protein